MLRSHLIGRELPGGHRGADQSGTFWVSGSKSMSREWITPGAPNGGGEEQKHGSPAPTETEKPRRTEDSSCPTSEEVQTSPGSASACLKVPTLTRTGGHSLSGFDAWLCSDGLFLSHRHPVELMNKQVSSPGVRGGPVIFSKGQLLGNLQLQHSWRP